MASNGGSLFPSAVPSSACEESNESKILCSPKIREALKFILSVLISAMPQRYETIKYFLCSRARFSPCFISERKAVVEITSFSGVLVWSHTRNLQGDANSANENQVDLSANRVYMRDGKQSTCSTVKFVSNYVFADENHFARKLFCWTGFSRAKRSLPSRGIVELTRTTFDCILQQRSCRIVVYCQNNLDAAFVELSRGVPGNCVLKYS